MTLHMGSVGAWAQGEQRLAKPVSERRPFADGRGYRLPESMGVNRAFLNMNFAQVRKSVESDERDEELARIGVHKRQIPRCYAVERYIISRPPP